jgi:acetyl-CoA C-acetyltransferase
MNITKPAGKAGVARKLEEDHVKEAVIVSVARTPVAKFRGDFAALSVPELGAIPMRAAVDKVGLDPSLIDEVIMGNLFGSDWGDPARTSLLKAGFPLSVPGISVDRQCSSSVNAVGMAAALVQTGMADIVLACGVESYSQQPFYIKRPGSAYPVSLETLEYKTNIEEYGGNFPMIITAENLAQQYSLSREECDAFALASHRKAAAAWEKGWFDEQVVPVSLPQTKGEIRTVKMDACVRPEASMESLEKLKPVMKKNGVVTAGNASPMNDGASAVLIMSREKAEERGLEALALIKEFCSAGCDPSVMGIGPVHSTRKLMQRYGYRIEDFGLVELNEAFAAQSIPCIRELGIDPLRVNVEGGAIAIGHPNGASGGILVARLVYALIRRNLKRGLISFCCGGGQGFSLVLENPKVA